jgi:hypothetical protein
MVAIFGDFGHLRGGRQAAAESIAFALGGEEPSGSDDQVEYLDVAVG